MLFTALGLAIAGCAMALPTSASAAWWVDNTSQGRPWCAAMSENFYDCAYSSYNQCMATASGAAGYCKPNPLVIEEAPLRRQPRRGGRHVTR